MKIAVLSGKGGTGKTFVSVNLASVSSGATYIDCDVEEPNGKLFLQGDTHSTYVVNTYMPSFDTAKCTGCRKCVDWCKFNALIFVKGTAKLFDEVCHSCNACNIICPTSAITMQAHPLGKVEISKHNDTLVVTGLLDIGKASGVPIIKECLRHNSPVTIVDCPPGSGCSVMESINQADYCIIVVEPTAFGFDNFQMVYNLAKYMGKKLGLVINKQDTPYAPLEQFIKQHDLDILMRIPFDKDIATTLANGEILVEKNAEWKKMFENLLLQIIQKVEPNDMHKTTVYKEHNNI